MLRVQKPGITVPELIGILALLGVLYAAVAPHWEAFRQDTQLSQLRFNLERLRTRIDEYRKQYGQPPGHLDDLCVEDGEPICENPLSLAPEKHRGRTKVIDVDPPTTKQVTPLGFGGWLYNPQTGGVWADSEALLGE